MNRPCVDPQQFETPGVITTGRAILQSVGLSKRSDFYSAILGAYVLWGAGWAAEQLWRIGRRGPGWELAREAGRAMQQGIRLVALLLLGVGLLPLSAGLFLDMSFLPLRYLPHAPVTGRQSRLGCAC